MPMMQSKSGRDFDVNGSIVLGKAIERAIDLREGLCSVAFPRGISRELVSALVNSANERALQQTQKQYALEVTAIDQDSHLRVHPNEVIRYRAGSRRLFVWEEGRFEPDSSFQTSVRNLIHEDFPSREASDLGVEDIAEGLFKEFQNNYKDSLNPGEWLELQVAVENVCNFARELFDSAGNEGLSTWTVGWWQLVAQMAGNINGLLAADADLEIGAGDLPYAAACLPVPGHSGASGYRYLKGPTYLASLESNWSNKDVAELSIARLTEASDLQQEDAPSPLATLSWGSEYERRKRSIEHSVLALTGLGTIDGSTAVDVWSRTTESDFMLLDTVVDSEMEVLAAIGATHLVDVLDQGGAIPIFVVPTDLSEQEGDESTFALGLADFRVRIVSPTLDLEDGDYPNDALTLDAANRFASVVVEKIEIRNSAIDIVGRLSFAPAKKASWPNRPVKIIVRASAGGGLAGAIGRSTEFALIFPDNRCACPTLVVVHASGRRKPKITISAGSKYSISTDNRVEFDAQNEDQIISLAAESRGAIWSYDGSDNGDPGNAYFLNRAAEESEDWSRLYAIKDAQFTHDDEITLGASGGDLLARFVVEDKTEKPWLPILATALGVSPLPQQQLVPREDRNSIRGELESRLVSRLRAIADGANPSSVALLQFLITEGEDGRFGKADAKSENGAFWVGEAPEHFETLQHVGAGPSAELLETDEFSNFWKAFLSIVKKIDLFQSDAADPWFSRASLLALKQSMVNEYLAAFHALCDTATHTSHADEFWARYPFCAMLLDTPARKIRGVLLSPMHPIRLAWLYGAEQAISESRWSESVPPLLQVLEGWNFPWLGPAPGVEGRYPVFAALPMDAGDTKLFTGWGLLVAFDNDGGPTELAPWFAGRRAPGSASSGLTAGGIAAAIRDYTKVHPFISTLTVDLASLSKAPRSAEIDRAVLSEVSNLVGSPRQEMTLAGGVRVHDSLNRQGDPPGPGTLLAGVANSGLSKSSMQFSWRRYNAERRAPSSDIRFVERGPSEFTAIEGDAAAATTYWPVRRFIPREGDHATELFGLISPDNAADGWSEFIVALSSFEARSGSNYALQVENSDVLGSTNSNSAWVVTGNVQVDPFILARAAARQGKYLWEWRPGYLPKRMVKTDTGAFGVRPYTTVAKIPDSFSEGIKRGVACSDDDVKNIFRELGARGVGLASLLAMGTTHVFGALGFYLAYKVLELIPPAGSNHRFVVPIDAVDLVFRAIADEVLHDETKRADLLIIDVCVEDKFVNFVPIEVKCYPSRAGSFPGVTTATVNDALVQLKDTMSILDKAINQIAPRGAVPRDQTKRPGSLELAALTSVVECGITLAADRPSKFDAHSILHGVATGSFKINTRKNLLIWFQENEQLDCSWRPDEPERNIGALFVDVNRAKEQAFGGGSVIDQDTAEQIGTWLELDAPDMPADEVDAVPAPTVPQRTEDDENNTEADSTNATQKIDDDSRDESDTADMVETSETSGAHGERVKFLVGTNMSGGKEEIWWDPSHPRTQLSNGHWVILGGSGAGKTQTIRALVSSLASQGVTPILLDFKDDFVDAEFLAEIGANLFEADDGLPFNPLEPKVDPMTGKIRIKSEVYGIAETLRKVHGLGDQQQVNLRKAIFEAYESFGISKDATKLKEGQELPNFDHVGEIVEHSDDSALFNRLSPIFDLGLFNSGRGGIAELLGRPSVVRLSQLPGEEVKKAAGELLLRSFYNFMVRQGHSDQEKQKLKYALVIDEAHKVANLASVKLLLKESRAYGVSVILSSQEARDFDEYVYANSGTLLSLKLSETNDSEKIAMLLAGAQDRYKLAQEIRALRPFEAFLRNDHYNSQYVRVKVKPHFERKGD